MKKQPISGQFVGLWKVHNKPTKHQHIKTNQQMSSNALSIEHGNVANDDDGAEADKEGANTADDGTEDEKEGSDTADDGGIAK